MGRFGIGLKWVQIEFGLVGLVELRIKAGLVKKMNRGVFRVQGWFREVKGRFGVRLGSEVGRGTCRVQGASLLACLLACLLAYQGDWKQIPIQHP